MFDLIRAFVGREKGLSRDQMAFLSGLPPADRLAPLGSLLHDACVMAAARFVEDEHGRSDSAFRELPKTDLFREILVLNFWILEASFGGKRPLLMEQVYRHYHTCFVGGREAPPLAVRDSLLPKFRTYDDAWDDYSGHQDVFARQAIAIIFDGRRVAETPQAAFWLISHADRTMKTFAEVKKSVDRLLPEAADPAGLPGQ